MTDVQTVSTSSQYSLNWKDISKGLLVAVISAVLTTIQTSIQAGSINFDWKAIGVVAGTAAVAYLLKNFFTPSQTIITPPVTAPGTTTTTADVKVTPK